MHKVDTLKAFRDRLEIIAIARSVVAPVEIVELVREFGGWRGKLSS